MQEEKMMELRTEALRQATATVGSFQDPKQVLDAAESYFQFLKGATNNG